MHFQTMTKAAMARRWQVTRQAVDSMVLRGMPTDSIEAAQEWRDNRPRAKKRLEKQAKKPKEKKQPSPEEEIRELASTNSWAGLNTTERLLRHLDQIHERMDFARREAKSSLKDDPELSRKWLTLEAQLASKAPAVERMIQEALEREKVTITAEDAQREFCGFLTRIRGHLERAPAALAGKCNPSDPEHAHQQIEQWIEGVFKSLHQAPSVTQ